jgi:hypothetical protein
MKLKLFIFQGTGLEVQFSHLDETNEKSLLAYVRSDRLKNFSKLSKFFQNLYAQPSYESIQSFLQKHSQKLQLVIDNFKKDDTSHAFNRKIHQINENFTELVNLLDLKDGYLPIQIDEGHHSNSFFKSISIFLYGTCDLWLLIKLGLVYFIFKNEDYFRNLVAEQTESLTYEHLLVQACQRDSFVNFYSQVAVFLLLERPIVCYNMVLNESSKATIKCLKYQFEEDANSENEIYLVYETLEKERQEFYKFAPLLPTKE